MSSDLIYSKTGLTLVCITAKRPLPVVTRAFPLPQPGTDQSALITAALEAVPSTGRFGIRVASISGEGLPGSMDDGGAWVLQHVAYVGSAPAVLPWEDIRLGYISVVSYLLSDPLPNATHRFRLVRQGVPGPPGRNVPAVIYPECTSVATADDKGVGTGVVMQQHLGNANTDNLIPNPTSEMGAAAPVGSWEAVLLVNDPANAYQGNWCRKLDSSATNLTALCAPLTANYGDQYTFDGQVKGSSASPGAKVRLVFQDGSGGTTGTADSVEIKSSSYTTIRVQGLVPSGTATVQAFVLASTTAASTFLYFDQFSLRRSVKPGHMDADSGFRLINALKNTGTTSLDRTYYAGNNDLTVRGGAPNIACLTATPQAWNTSANLISMDLKLQPTAANDNLDAMRPAKIQLYRQSAAGTTGTLALIGTFYMKMDDRLFVSSTDSNSANSVTNSMLQYMAGINGGVPAMLITLYNANGPSDTHCFYSAAGWSAGAALTDNGASWPAGLTGGTGGGSGGGSGGGGACPAPWVMVDLAGGRQKAAGELQAGDLVWTQDPSTGTTGQWPVLSVSTELSDRYDVVFEDGLVLTFALRHRLRTSDGWTQVEELWPGLEVLGDSPRKVASSGFRDNGEVVRITVDKAHSYQTTGLLSSNTKPVG